MGYDHVIAPMLLALFMVVIPMLEWWRYVSNAKPSPWLFSGAATLACVYAAVKVLRNHKKKFGNSGSAVMGNGPWRSGWSGCAGSTLSSFTTCLTAMPMWTMC